MTPRELREKRLAAGLTQAQLAAMMQVTPSTVARWEQGVMQINQGLVALAFRVIELERAKE